MPEARRATEKDHQLAGRLLASEAGGNAGSVELVDSTVRVLNRFSVSLGSLIGLAGYEALLHRALHLAGTEGPFLRGIPVQVTTEGIRLPGLVERVQGLDPSAVRLGLTAIIANLIWLLVTFIGEAISTQLIHQAFAEVPPAPGDATREGKR